MAILRLYNLVSLISTEWRIAWPAHLFTCHCFHIYYLLLGVYHGGILEVVAHPCDTLGADAVDVAFVRLVLGKVAVNKALGNVEDDAVGEASVTLHPPGILVIPHADA